MKKEFIVEKIHQYNQALGQLTMYISLIIVIVGLPCQIYQNSQEGKCGIHVVIISMMMLLYLVRVPYSIGKRAWHLLPADILAFILAMFLLIQYFVYL